MRLLNFAFCIQFYKCEDGIHSALRLFLRHILPLIFTTVEPLYYLSIMGPKIKGISFSRTVMNGHQRSQTVSHRNMLAIVVYRQPLLY